MKFERKKIAVALACALGTGGTLLIAAAPSQAADISVSVTGTNIRRADTETASPVQVLTREDLDRSGYTTIEEVLRDITANGNGLLSQSFSRAFAGGASGVALRGLSVGATLVLIDGVRMAPYPLADDNQRGFVDVSSIPFAAIERVEVLLDGASAIYGSDAIGGVVNIILKKSFTGTQLTAQAGTTYKGDGTTVHAAITHGFGGDGPYNGFLTVEYRHQDQIKLQDRSGARWATVDFRSQGGSDLRPGALAPTISTPAVLGAPYLFRNGGSATNPADYAFLTPNCDFTRLRASQCLYTDTWSQIQPETQNINVLGSFNAKLGGGWQLNLTGSYFDSESETVFIHSIYPFGSSSGVIGYGPGSPATILNAVPNPGFTVPVNYPGNTLGAKANVRGLLPDGPTGTDYDSGSTRIVAALTGAYAGWDLNGTAGYTKVKTKATYSGGYNLPALRDALNDPVNPYLVTGGNSPELQAIIQPKLRKTTTSELDFVQANGTRDLMKLEGGPLGLALGASYVYQKLNGNNFGEPCTKGTVAGPNCAYAIGDQSVTAVYGEFNAPVLKSLELSGALRYDYYDTYGGQFTPKVGAKWTPMKEVGLRGTWGKGFRAPFMTENGDSQARYGLGTLRDPILCAASSPDGTPNLTSPLNVPSQCSFSVAFQQGTNKDLDAEKSTNWTAGLILEPVQDWSITADYYSIEVTDRITTQGALGSFDQYANTTRGIPQQATYGDGTTKVTPVGLIQYVSVGYVNANKLATTGIDLQTSYSFKLPDASRLRLTAQWSHILSYDLTNEGVKYKLAGTHGPSDVSANTGNPRDRLQLSAQWMKGPFTGTLMGNMVGSMDPWDPSAGTNNCVDGVNEYNPQRWLNNPTGFPSKYCKVDAFWYWNLNLQYQHDKQTMVQFSVTNLFNQKAPVDMNTYGGPGVNRTMNNTGVPLNVSLHGVGAVGTAFMLGLTYNF